MQAQAYCKPGLTGPAEVAGRRLRILYYYGSQQFDTGSPKALAGFIDVLDRSLFEPWFLATGDGPLIDALAARNVRIVRDQVASVSRRSPLRGVRNVLRHAARLDALGIDVLHVMEYGWNFDVVLAAWFRRIPVVLHVHVPSSAELQNLHRFAAARVLFCSAFEMLNFQHGERISGKGDVLYNCVDLAAVRRGKSIRRELGLSQEDIAIGTIAQIKHGKGIDLVLETARLLLPQCKNLVFLLAGRPDPRDVEFEPRMRRAAADPAFGGRVRLLGSRPDIPDLLASLDLLFHPTRAEAFGIVVIEGLAAGLPVVASRVGGIPEIISSPELGCLVEPLTGEAFAAAIRGVLEMPDRGRAMAQRGGQSLAGRFDGPAIAEKLQKIYLDLAARREAGLGVERRSQRSVER